MAVKRGRRRGQEVAGLKRQEAEAVASAIREGRGQLENMAELRGETGRFASRMDALADRIGTLQWVARAHLAISWATLAAVLAMAIQPKAEARA